MNTHTHHNWHLTRYVVSTFLVLCLAIFCVGSRADDGYASYDVSQKQPVLTDEIVKPDTTLDLDDLHSNHTIIDESNWLNIGEVKYLDKRLVELYHKHHIHTTILLISKKDEQALTDAQQFVKQWQAKDTTHQELLVAIFFDNTHHKHTQNAIFTHNLEHLLPKETKHRITQDMSYYSRSHHYFDGIDWALDSVVELLEDNMLGYKQIADKAEYDFGQLFSFVLVWTLVAIVAILVISQSVNVYLAKWLGQKNSYGLSVLLVLVLFAGIGYRGWLKMGWYGVMIGVPLVWLACSKLTSKPLLILNKEELEEIERSRVGGGGGYGDSGGSDSSYSGGGGDFGGGGAGDSW